MRISTLFVSFAITTSLHTTIAAAVDGENLRSPNSISSDTALCEALTTSAQPTSVLKKVYRTVDIRDLLREFLKSRKRRAVDLGLRDPEVLAVDSAKNYTVSGTDKITEVAIPTDSPESRQKLLDKLIDRGPARFYFQSGKSIVGRLVINQKELRLLSTTGDRTYSLKIDWSKLEAVRPSPEDLILVTEYSKNELSSEYISQHLKDLVYANKLSHGSRDYEVIRLQNSNAKAFEAILKNALRAEQIPHFVEVTFKDSTTRVGIPIFEAQNKLLSIDPKRGGVELAPINWADATSARFSVARERPRHSSQAHADINPELKKALILEADELALRNDERGYFEILTDLKGFTLGKQVSFDFGYANPVIGIEVSSSPQIILTADRGGRNFFFLKLTDKASDVPRRDGVLPRNHLISGETFEVNFGNWYSREIYDSQILAADAGGVTFQSLNGARKETYRFRGDYFPRENNPFVKAFETSFGVHTINSNTFDFAKHLLEGGGAMLHTDTSSRQKSKHGVISFAQNGKSYAITGGFGFVTESVSEMSFTPADERIWETRILSQTRPSAAGAVVERRFSLKGERQTDGALLGKILNCLRDKPFPESTFDIHAKEGDAITVKFTTNKDSAANVEALLNELESSLSASPGLH